MSDICIGLLIWTEAGTNTSSDDPEAVRPFYESVFGWKIQKWNREQSRRRSVNNVGQMNSYTLEPVGFIRSTLKRREEAPRQGPEGAPDAWLAWRARMPGGRSGSSRMTARAIGGKLPRSKHEQR
jgi:hypothetical protein